MRTLVFVLFVLASFPLTSFASDSGKQIPSICLMKVAGALPEIPPLPPEKKPLPHIPDIPLPKRPEPKPMPAPSKAMEIAGRWDAAKKTCSPITVSKEGKFSFDDLLAPKVSASGEGMHCNVCPTYCPILQYEAVRDSKGNIIGYHVITVQVICSWHSCC